MKKFENTNYSTVNACGLAIFSNFYLHQFFSHLPFFQQDPHVDSPEAIRVKISSIMMQLKYWGTGLRQYILPTTLKVTARIFLWYPAVLVFFIFSVSYLVPGLTVLFGPQEENVGSRGDNIAKSRQTFLFFFLLQCCHLQNSTVQPLLQLQQYIQVTMTTLLAIDCVRFGDLIWQNNFEALEVGCPRNKQKSVRTKINRNKICFWFCFSLFCETKNKNFGFVLVFFSVFRTFIETTEINRTVSK